MDQLKCLYKIFFILAKKKNSMNFQNLTVNYIFIFMGFFINIRFKKIENLNLFINVQTLWLENNFIEKIENLECLINLHSLFL